MVEMSWVETLAQTAPQTAADSGSFVGTVWDLIVKGGWVMIPLGITSLAALTIIAERLILTRRARISPPALEQTLATLREKPRQAIAACESNGSPLAAVIGAAVKSRHETRDAQEKRVAEAGEREVQKLRRRMRVLSAMPQAATMLGLLGTVLGMIRTFTVVAASGESLGKTERLAQGIYEAWTATAAGLIVAIPVLIAYHMVMARIDAAAELLDKAAMKWLDGGHEAIEANAADEPLTDSAVSAGKPALVGAEG